MEAYGNSVDEKSERAGGTQRITTLDGYVLPVDILEGLPYLRTRAYTDKEYDKLPHVILSSESDWDPTVFDTKPPVNRDTVLKYLKEAKIEHWHGTSHNFVQHWLAQVCLAETLIKGRLELEQLQDELGPPPHWGPRIIPPPEEEYIFYRNEPETFPNERTLFNQFMRTF